MKNYKRSDLACEAADDLAHVDGTEYSKEEESLYTKESLKINTDGAADALGKRKGTYVTFTTSEIWKLDEPELSELSAAIASQLSAMICGVTGRARIISDVSVLVVGLGNTLITADAIGPRATEGIEATRHVKKLDPSLFELLRCCEIATVIPGVMGRTGIESAEIVKAACREVEPDVVIVIDALAAGATERLGRTVQISDTGISPGAGIGNLRSELSRNTLECPVIAIGVPTVVDSSAVVYDAICRSGISDRIPSELIAHLESAEKFYVTPKESDIMTEKVSSLLAMAISESLVIS